MLKPLDKHTLCDTDKPLKFESPWEETLWTTYSYKMMCPECDSKRTGPCKHHTLLTTQPEKETL